MNEKDVSPMPPGENKGADEDDDVRILRQSSSSGKNINLPFAPKYPQKARSRQTAALQASINFTIARLSVGKMVSEADVYENSQSRYRRSESLMVLREVHRRYPRQTTLALRKGPGAGMWVLLPVSPRRRP